MRSKYNRERRVLCCHYAWMHEVLFDLLGGGGGG